MTDRLDVCLWTKNSAKLLPRTLQRFEEVVPAEMVGKKILVDDHSSDNTTEIAKGYGWLVYENPKSGVASGANEALRHVSTPFFNSIEHDILLAKEWWPRIYPQIRDILKRRCEEP
ncbi:MAG: glycosyltransferase [Candidatus Bathyarchaeia archaeon]